MLFALGDLVGGSNSEERDVGGTVEKRDPVRGMRSLVGV